MPFEYEVVDRPAQPYVALRDVVPMDRVSVVADRFGELFGWLGQRSLNPVGPPFLRYRVIQADGRLDMEAGIPVGGEVSAEGAVSVDVLPAGRFLMAEHLGPYSGVGALTADLLAWAHDHLLSFDQHAVALGEEWGCRLEIYPTDPRQEPDPQRWLTLLAFKLA